MNSTRPLVIAVGFILGAELAVAQDLSRNHDPRFREAAIETG